MSWIFSDLPLEDDVSHLRYLSRDLIHSGGRGSLWVQSVTPPALLKYEQRWAALHDVNIEVS